MKELIANDILRYIEDSLKGLSFNDYTEVALMVGDKLGSKMIKDFKAYDNIRSKRMERLEAEIARLKEELEEEKAKNDHQENFYLSQIAIHNINTENAHLVKRQKDAITNMRRSYRATIKGLQDQIDNYKNI